METTFEGLYRNPERPCSYQESSCRLSEPRILQVAPQTRLFASLLIVFMCMGIGLSLLSQALENLKSH